MSVSHRVAWWSLLKTRSKLMRLIHGAPDTTDLISTLYVYRVMNTLLTFTDDITKHVLYRIIMMMIVSVCHIMNIYY